MASKKQPALMPIPGLDDPEPGKFAFTRRLDELFARGWPYLRVLTDEGLAPAQAKREALKACQAIDPYLPTVVPRDVARRMLSGYQFHPYKQPAETKAAIAKPVEVDAALMTRIFETKLRDLAGETYVFRIREVVFLLEAFLGTETVAEALVEHFVQGFDPLAWGKTAFEQDHENWNFRRTALAFGWLRLRMPKERWAKLVKPLAKGNPKLPRYSATLAQFADDTVPASDDDYGRDRSLQRRDPAPFHVLLERWPKAWDDAQIVYTLGPDFLKQCNVTGLRLSPKWQQQRYLAELGAIRAPGTLRVIEALLGSRSVADVAMLWLQTHRDWVEADGLPALDGWSHTRAVAENVRAVLRGEELPPPPKPAELKKQLKKLFAELPTAMKGCTGDPKAERAAMRSAFETYCEINAALGEISPDAYFTHQLDLKWRAPEADVHRWIDIAVDVAVP